MMNETERLRQRTKEYQEDLRKDRERRKPSPNQRMDEDIPQFLPSYDFWCEICQEDFTAPARKSSYRFEGNIISTIRGRCPECETIAIRYATHRDQDPYYAKSLKIRRQRNQYALEMLQAEQYGFRTQYGEPYEEFNRKMAAKDEIRFGKKRETGLKGLSLEEKEVLLRRNKLL